MLPCEFSALLDRHEQAIQQEYLGHAITASVIANVNRGKGSRMFTPQDFMPGPRKERKQTPEEMVKMLELLAASGQPN
ncbi:MAG: hypothetical protein L0312_12725 [Acidobacteria bacterium]|nr:hypothetical protein [Acidobacteriota bacterium]